MEPDKNFLLNPRIYLKKVSGYKDRNILSKENPISINI
jgi:hypothetical protein